MHSVLCGIVFVLIGHFCLAQPYGSNSTHALTTEPVSLSVEYKPVYEHGDPTTVNYACAGDTILLTVSKNSQPITLVGMDIPFGAHTSGDLTPIKTETNGDYTAKTYRFISYHCYTKNVTTDVDSVMPFVVRYKFNGQEETATLRESIKVRTCPPDPPRFSGGTILSKRNLEIIATNHTTYNGDSARLKAYWTFTPASIASQPIYKIDANRKTTNAQYRVYPFSTTAAQVRVEFNEGDSIRFVEFSGTLPVTGSAAPANTPNKPKACIGDVVEFTIDTAGWKKYVKPPMVSHIESIKFIWPSHPEIQLKGVSGSKVTFVTNNAQAGTYQDYLCELHIHIYDPISKTLPYTFDTILVYPLYPPVDFLVRGLSDVFRADTLHVCQGLWIEFDSLVKDPNIVDYYTLNRDPNYQYYNGEFKNVDAADAGLIKAYVNGVEYTAVLVVDVPIASGNHIVYDGSLCLGNTIELSLNSNGLITWIRQESGKPNDTLCRNCPSNVKVPVLLNKPTIKVVAQQFNSCLYQPIEATFNQFVNLSPDITMTTDTGACPYTPFDLKAKINSNAANTEGRYELFNLRTGQRITSSALTANGLRQYIFQPKDSLLLCYNSTTYNYIATCSRSDSARLVAYPTPTFQGISNSPLHQGAPLEINFVSDQPTSLFATSILTHNGVTIPADQYSVTLNRIIYSKSNVQLSDTGTYKLLVITTQSCSVETSIHVDVSSENIRPALKPGSIGESQTICHNSRPQKLNLKNNVSGGDGIYSYQWQTSLNGTDWTNIENATSANDGYLPSALTKTAHYRLLFTDSRRSDTVYSNVVTITVYEPLQAGTLNEAQTICYNTSPHTIRFVQMPGGEDGDYTYRWQQVRFGKPDTKFTDLPNQNNPDLNPGLLTDSARYRVIVTSKMCKTSDTTTAVAIHVLPLFKPGKIGYGDTVCQYASPKNIRLIEPCSGSDKKYSYQWQRCLPDSTIFENIQKNAQSTTYVVPPLDLFGNYYFRLKFNDEHLCGPVYSDTVRFHVRPLPKKRDLVGDFSVCRNQSDCEYFFNDVEPLTRYEWSVTGGTITQQLDTNRIVVHWDNTAGNGRIILLQTYLPWGCQASDILYSVEKTAYAAPNKTTITQTPNTNILTCAENTPGTIYQWGFRHLNSDTEVLLSQSNYQSVQMPHTIDLNLYEYFVLTSFQYENFIGCTTKSFFTGSLASEYPQVLGQNFVIYPNPTRRDFVIQTQEVGTSDITVSISTLDGRLVFKKTYQPSETLHCSPALLPGLYIVSLRTATAMISRKLVVVD